MLQKGTLEFLKNLDKNNSKAWFDENKKTYEAAKLDFIHFIQMVIDKLGKTDPSIEMLQAKDCIFRINRDVRFSKDKSPYKNNFGASINKGGRKAVHSAGYYFHLQSGQIFAGGGIWMPETEHLKNIRQEIDYNYKEFKKIVHQKSFEQTYGDLSRDEQYTLSRVPKGYESDNEAAEYLKLKSFVAMTKISDEIAVSNDLVKQTVKSFETLQPLLQFLNGAME